MPLEGTYHPNGQLKNEQPTVGGRPHGIARSWYPNGQLQSETPFRDGLAHGIWKHWAQDGRLLGTFEMVDGTGTFRTWYDDGRLRTEVSAVRGLPSSTPLQSSCQRVSPPHWHLTSPESFRT